MRTVIGIHSCEVALKVRSEKELKKIFFKPNYKDSSSLTKLEKLAQKKGLTPQIISIKKLNAYSDSHQGVLLFVDHVLERKPFSKEAVVLVLDGVEDTHNLGAILRTSWLMGVEAIFVPKHRSVGLTPSVMKAACGGAEHVPVEVVSNIAQCLKWLKKENFWVYGLDGKSAHVFWQESFPERVAFVLGGENLGIKNITQKNCDKLLSFPQKEKQASYNVSVSAGIILAECFRQKMDK